MENVLTGQMEEFQNKLHDARRIVFFGGAGVSTESGIPDFRSAAGIYAQTHSMQYSPETMLSHSFFMSRPEEFYAFYKSKMLYPDASPNDAHRTLAKMEEQGRLSGVITQNIDGLHQAAGSKNVVELHGSVHRNYCMSCKKSFPLPYLLHDKEIVPKCGSCGGIVRPDVVLYEEMLSAAALMQAKELIQQADLLIIGGTSLGVYPAAGLVGYCQKGSIVLVNLSETPYDHRADIVLRAKVGETLKAAWETV
ncbi:MAG: NAD-dependent protein deacylase [Christensenellales bacterium]